MIKPNYQNQEWEESDDRQEIYASIKKMEEVGDLQKQKAIEFLDKINDDELPGRIWLDDHDAITLTFESGTEFNVDCKVKNYLVWQDVENGIWDENLTIQQAFDRYKKWKKNA